MDDNVRELMVKYTVIEEKQNRASRSFERVFTRLEEVEKLIQEQAQKTHVNAVKIGMNERIAWMLLSAAVGAGSYFLN